MRKTKMALLQSIAALIVCLSMLVGTTMAWFTDTAVSGVNSIIAGNLDVALVDQAGNSLEGQSLTFRNVDGSAAILWEPGCTFKTQGFYIANLGTLALDYSMYINGLVGDAKLLEVIEFYLVDAAGNKLDLDSYKGRLSPKAKSDLFYLVGHMAESAGNEYQNLTLAGIGITVHATQAAQESDSFGPDYDAGAAFPVLKPGIVTADITGKVADGALTEDVTMTNDAGTISVFVPAGTKVTGNTLVASVSEKAASDANIKLTADEALRPMDVHIDGIAADNTVPAQVTVQEAMMPGLNIGNYKLYHVEKSGTNEMTPGDLGVHNGFCYDPATGDVTVALATFSEVALVAEEAKWEGKFDYTWYDASKTELTIANADQLAAFGAIVGGMAKDKNGEFLITYTDSDGDVHHNDSFDGKTVKLIADINLGDDEEHNNEKIIFYPIGYWNNEGTYERKPLEERTTAVESGFYAFEGTFDGNGNTIKNFYQNTWEMKGDHNWYDPIKEQYFRDGFGLFGKVYGGTVKNLIVDNYSCDSEIGTTGVIAAYADSKNGQPALFENITITNCNPRVYNIGNGGIVGCAGWYSRNESLGKADYTNAVTFRNITVDQTNKISALWGSWGVSCAGILGQYYPNSACGIKMENCHVAAIIDVNNDVCSNYQYYWYRYAGMFIGTIRANKKDANGYEIADTTGVFAKDCTYTMGNWNEYWYCEIVANSLASYTHDHQFSRLDNITSLSEIQNADGTWKKEGHFALLSADRKSVECYHIFKDSNGKLYQHFHDKADESNPNIYESFDLNGDGELNDLKEDRQRYFIPFNQLMTGLDMGIKAHTEFTDSNGDTIKFVENGVVKSEEKFESIVTNGSYKPGQTITLGELVKAIVDESKIAKATLYAAVSPAVGNENTKVDATFSLDASNWKNSSITFGENCTGAVKIVITDYFYCTPTVIVLNESGRSEKFDAKTVGAQNAYTKITLGDLLTAKDGVTIGNVTATVTDPKGNVTTLTGTDWASLSINLIKDGKWTVSIVDDDKYCAATTVEFTVNKVDKFTKKFDKNFLYRVGNAENSTVGIGYIFGEIETAVGLSSVNVKIETVAGNAAGTFISATTWTNGTIQFTGTGVVKVTISADGANPVELNLEVVDAVNATGATNATSNNVVLLNDIGSGFTVSGNYTFYGNGFTLNYTGDGRYLNNGLKQGLVTVSENGTLDNLHIKASIYPTAFMYYGATSLGEYVRQDSNPREVEGEKTRYYYQLSGVVAKGNATIQNCYIYGGRTNVFVDTGNVTIKDSIFECGTVANVQIQSTAEYTVTLEDVTTIQYQVNATIGDTSKVMLGTGILVGPDTTSNPTIVLNGNFKQYNWVTQEDCEAVSSNMAKMIINGALNATAYNHTINGKTASNLGIIYMNTEKATVTNNTGLPYVCQEITMTVSGQEVDGKAYSLQNASADQIYSDHFNADRSTVNGDYLPTFDFDLGDQLDTNDGNEDNRYLYGDKNGIEALYQDGYDPITLNIDRIASIYKYTGIPYTVTAKCLDANGKELTKNNGVVTLDAKGTYTLVFTVTDNIFYDQDGNAINKSVERTYTVPLTLYVKAADIKNAVVNITKTALDGVYNTVNWTDYELRIKFLDCISVTDYDNKGNGTTVNLSSNISSATLTPSGVNVFTTAFAVTITYTDGRVLTVNFSKISGSSPGTKTGKVNTSGSVYFTTEGALDNKPTEASSQNKCTITSVSFKGNSGSTITNDTDVTVTWALGSSSGSNPCVTPDTLVTLADGTQKRIDEVTYADQLLVWNFYTGAYDVVPATIVMNHGYDTYTVVSLRFDDGTVVNTINGHGFFDVASRKYVILSDHNAADYIGHDFLQVDGDGYKTVKLVEYSVKTEYTESWSILTAEHFNCILENMWTLTPAEVEGSTDYLMPFEIGADMKFDEAKMLADIEKYGLYTYAEFADYMTEDQFVVLGLANWKIAVGKGFITWDEILYLIDIHLNN